MFCSCLLFYWVEPRSLCCILVGETHLFTYWESEMINKEQFLYFFAIFFFSVACGWMWFWLFVIEWMNEKLFALRPNNKCLFASFFLSFIDLLCYSDLWFYILLAVCMKEPTWSHRWYGRLVEHEHEHEHWP